jgi:hypothetical protein
MHDRNATFFPFAGQRKQIVYRSPVT